MYLLAEQFTMQITNAKSFEEKNLKLFAFVVSSTIAPFEVEKEVLIQ
jgi:hypothetical protein